MTTTAATAAVRRRPTDSTRNNVRAAGIFYLLTFAASIPAWILLDPILTDPDYITAAGNDSQVLIAAWTP